MRAIKLNLRFLFLFIILAICASVSVTVYSQENTCTSSGCHEGIEAISPYMDFNCVVCHKGDDSAQDKESSHIDMYVNPGEMNIVDSTCGTCHPEKASNLEKSLHATSAGVISGARYTWGAQDRESIYANYAVEDTDGDVPTQYGAKSSFEQIPMFSESGEPVDDYLRNQCLRCHVGTEGKKTRGDYRSSGCSACHVVYSDDGYYSGNDQIIPKDEPDHPIKHEITTQIPSQQCIHCHNRGGRTGVSYIGTMESAGYGTPFTEGGEKQPTLHGKYYNGLTADIHFDKGMECIDCHTSREVHGDGNIYGKKEQAVEIECIDCHGTPDEYPWNVEEEVITSGATKSTGDRYGIEGGNIITNIVKTGEQLALTSKYSGQVHEVPVLKTINEADSWTSDWAETSMSDVPHTDTLECYACHASWAPQCYGCHAKMDETKTGNDWISGGQDAVGWSESRSYLRWENPVLGINAEGNVAPFIPGCQVIFTQINSDGETVLLNNIYSTVDGTSGIAQNPIQPHTTSAVARRCESCHTDSKALGLGTGTYDPRANGLDIDFELERIVDEDGIQIQATSHEGARPFNKEEQDKINRAGLCIGCHNSYDDPVWKDVTDIVGFAANTESHKEIMETALTSLIPETEPEPDPVDDTEPPDESKGGVIPGFPIGALITGASIGYVVLFRLKKRH